MSRKLQRRKRHRRAMDGHDPLAHRKAPFFLEGRRLCDGCGRPLAWYLTKQTGGRWAHSPGDPFPPSPHGC